MKRVEELAKAYYEQYGDSGSVRLNIVAAFEYGFRAALELAACVAEGYPGEKSAPKHTIFDKMHYAALHFACPMLAQTIRKIADEEVP